MATFMDDDTNEIQTSQHVPDLPPRPKPKGIPTAPTSPWLPTGEPAQVGKKTDVKTTVARIGGIILPLAGIAALIYIGYNIYTILVGVYNG